jgi:hypothetical protein
VGDDGVLGGEGDVYDVFTMMKTMVKTLTTMVTKDVDIELRMPDESPSQGLLRLAKLLIKS